MEKKYWNQCYSKFCFYKIVSNMFLPRRIGTEELKIVRIFCCCFLPALQLATGVMMTETWGY